MKRRLSKRFIQKTVFLKILSNILKETVTEILTSQTQRHEKVLESVISTNKKIVESVKSIVESHNKTNESLREAVDNLSKDMKLLEKQIGAMKNVEIPAPIVNFTIPPRTVKKTVYRDEKGLITHITETEEPDSE